MDRANIILLYQLKKRVVDLNIFLIIYEKPFWAFTKFLRHKTLITPLKRSSDYSRIWIMSWFIHWRENKVLARTSPAAAWREPAASSCLPPDTHCAHPFLVMSSVPSALYNVHSSENWVTSANQRLREECSRCKVTQRSTQVNRWFGTIAFSSTLHHLNVRILHRINSITATNPRRDLFWSSAQWRSTSVPLIEPPWWRWPLSAVSNI